LGIDGGSVVSHYRLLEKLGEGGMGVVWRALDTVLDREVALKFLPQPFEDDPALLARLEAEAKTIAALSHPNIVTLHAIEDDGERRFLIMELVRGQTLDQRIPERGLPLREFLDLAGPLAEAVAAAHALGIAHRDLKPRNVMVTENGIVKVLDFGLAGGERLAAPRSELRDTTRTAPAEAPQGAGTLSYMAPEVLRGEPSDRRSDLFSLGVVLYEMACGAKPFEGSTAATMAASILRDRPASVTRRNPEMPRQLDRLLARCLEKDPTARPASADDVVADLRALGREARAGRRTGRTSIAVLPFADMSPERDQDYFCEGIAEEILTSLSRIRGLRVASRTSSFRFRGSTMDSREIADRLGVGALLDGSVRKSGPRLRVTAELIDAGDGCQLWTERYDREIADVFAIQEEIAQSIVRALAITLSPKERRAIRQVATEDVEAYEYYLRGRKYFAQYARRGIEVALQMFSRAIQLDPTFARAFAGVADCCSFLFMNVDHGQANRERADEASRRAIELDPELPEGYVARGVAMSIAGRAEEAESAFQVALRLDPQSFEAHYFHARELFGQGQVERAIAEYETAHALRPEDYQSTLLVAQIYEDLGRRDDAADRRRRGVEAARARLDLEPDDVRALYMGANGLVGLGEIAEGVAWAQRARAIAPDDTMLLYNLGCIHALAGESGPALDCLERAVDLGFAHRPWIENDSNLDPLRGDPRFAAILSRLA